MEEIEEDFESNYVEMTIDEMKGVKDTWKLWGKMIMSARRKVQNIEETKENRWDLKALECILDFDFDITKKIVKIYSELINLGEDCELDEEYFIKQMKKAQRLHKELQVENKKASTKRLFSEYIDDLREAKNIVSQ